MTNSQEPSWDAPGEEPKAEVLPPITATKDSGKLPEGVEIDWHPHGSASPAFADYGFEMHPQQTFADGTVISQSISRPASPADQQERDNSTEGTSESPQLTTGDGSKVMGDVIIQPTPDLPPEGEEHHTRERVPIAAITRRFQKEGRWTGQIELQRDEMMKLARKRFPDKGERQQWVYGELNRMYPPPLELPSGSVQVIPSRMPVKSASSDANVVNDFSAIAENPRADDGSIQGLSTIPKGWPELPANASLASEVAWVQANRLRIVNEQLGKPTRVDLASALSPAPSWAALGWLETSIRSYAKFVDVAAKASGADDGEQGLVRRERMAIEEVRSLLAEMEEAGESGR